DEAVDDGSGVVVGVAVDGVAAPASLEVLGAVEQGRILPGIALGELLVVAADHGDEAGVDLPGADLELADVLAFGHMDRVAALAFLQRLEGIPERLLLRAVA